MTDTTTTGSIDAKLGIDLDAFKRGAAQVKAEARELGAMDPTIKVDANVSEAVTKLDSVRVAEQRVETATRQAANTASTAYIAHERLTAIMESAAAPTCKWPPPRKRRPGLTGTPKRPRCVSSPLRRP
ncbi:hypothetical protein AHiyo8_48600 [Arthrobacter sp. Hiyo8]|nr:hypothetical protein AHiyo8_48600 [Arthrobacter sp. Hiyo8]